MWKATTDWWHRSGFARRAEGLICFRPPFQAPGQPRETIWRRSSPSQAFS